MKNIDVVILTQKGYVNPTEISDYIKNVLDEDNYVKKALERKGLKVLRLSWDDSSFDWSTTKAVIFRTTWDYFERFKEFSNWLSKIKKVTKLINSEEIIYWNIDKHYLQDLKENSINIVPSRFIETNENITLKELVKETNWTNFVLKPCVSGAARHTYKVNENNIDEIQEIFSDLIKSEAMLIQPFITSILDKGEVSHMVMNGTYTHSILKIAKAGDFRVQDDFGGTVHNYKANEQEILFAEHVFKTCGKNPIYGRVDVVLDNNNELAVSELELIEPELWFRNYPKATDILADGIVELLRLELN